MAINVVFSGPILNNSGYGRHATDIACSLLRRVDANGDKMYNCKFAYQRWGSCPPVNLDEEEKYNPYIKELLQNMLTGNLTERPDVFMQISIPSEFNPIGKYNIGITAGIESTVPPGQFIEGLNRMNMNIVPSAFNKQVFESIRLKKQLQNGEVLDINMTSPMEVVFEGVNTDIYKPVSSNKNLLNSCFDSIPEDFVFLFMGHWLQGEYGHDRKDVGTLIKTFCEVFKNKKNKPALILKTNGATTSEIDKNDIIKKINDVRMMVSGNDFPNIYLLHGELNDEEINSLYNHPKIKAMVSFTHGESWGRPLIEFSMTGKPVIVSAWSGHLDFLPKEHSVLLPGSLKEVHRSVINDWFVKEAKVFYVNQTISMKCLVDVYNNYTGFSAITKPLAEINKNKFNMNEFDKLFWSVLDKYIPEFPKEASLVLPKLKFK